MAFAMKTHDTEVPAKARRRRFTAEYKQKTVGPRAQPRVAMKVILEQESRLYRLP
jgi:hypothetical protein